MSEGFDLEALRRRSAWVLDEVQQLPGFAEALAKVGAPPEFAREWSWDGIVNATESDRWRPGIIRWEDRPAGDVSAAVLVGPRDTTLPSAGKGMVRAPVDEALPEPADRDALSTYRAAVSEFATAYALDAEWSARAVHDAIRLGQPIRLPDRPEPWVAPPLQAPFTLNPDQPLPRSLIIELGEALLMAAEDATPDTPKVSGSIPGDPVWQGAIEAIRVRLAGQAVPVTHRSQAHRLRPWLNAAVNGAMGAAPLHRVDAPDYAKRRRERESRVRRGRAGEGRQGR
jgi:hypothetical protein